jgi:hypothetical protein
VVSSSAVAIDHDALALWDGWVVEGDRLGWMS